MCVKSELRSIWSLQQIVSDLGFLLMSKLCHQGVVCSWPGAIYMHENIKKCVNQTSKVFFFFFFFFFLNLQKMMKMIRPFCWHQNSDPKGLFALAPGLHVYRRFLGFPLWRSFSRMRISLAVNTSARSMAVYNEAMGWKWIMQKNNLKRLLFYKYNKSCR